MTAYELAILVAGAAAAGFVNGLAGFGTSLFALGFWLQVFPPLNAVAMAVVVATVTGAQGLWVVRSQMNANKGRILRFLLPGLIGIPLGVAALAWIEPRWLKLLIAAVMLLYGLFFFTRGSLPKLERPTRAADLGFGFIGGILGGLAGLSGALVVMWLAMRPWPRHETRAVLQPYNFVILLITAILLAFNGAYTRDVLTALAIAIVIGTVAAQTGIYVFKRISDVQFRWLLVILMFLSGAGLMLREFL